MTGKECKKCSKCGEVKALEAFSPHAECKGGYRPECKACVAANTRRWYKRTQDKRRALNAERLADPEYQKAAAARSRAHYRANREAKMAYQREYAKLNPEVGHRGRHTRRARLLDAESEPYTRREIYDRDEGVCRGCGTPQTFEEFHVDHVVPLARGGDDLKDNLQVLCERCNREKWARTDWVPPRPSLF